MGAALASKAARGRSAHTEKLLGKQLPANVEAERAVLASILLNEENLSLVVDHLRPIDFYGRNHQLIYEAILELAQKDKKIDLVTLNNTLEQKGAIDNIGGLQYLIELQEDIPAIGLATQHAEIVKEKAILRELIATAANIITASYSQNQEGIDSVLDAAEKNIFQISNKRTTPTFAQLDIWLKKTFDHLNHIRSKQEGVTGIPSGFTKFDEMTSGMQRGELLILAGRPSMGKTILGMNMAVNAAREGHSVGIFSLEMSAEQLVLRMLSSESKIPHQKIRNASITSEEWLELTNTAGRLAEAKIFIDDSPSLSILELRAKARKLKAKSDINLLVIDYLQLIHGSGRHENRTQEISEISRSLKALAKELSIPILALSQLSRQLESRMDKRPQLSDLRESGAIEQDGDVIFFIYRDVIYNPDTETPDLSEIIIGKQRNGPIGTFYARFSGETTSFEDLAEEY